jgi:hypothetical protein
MLRKLLIFVCLFSATTSIAQVGITPIKTTEKQKEIDYKEIGAPLPPFKFIELHSIKPAASTAEPQKKSKKDAKEEDPLTNTTQTLLTDKDFDNGANLFIMMFNPTCSHCEDETRMLQKNIGLFTRSQIILMANLVMKPYMPDFINNLHTDDFASIHTGVDSAGFIDKVFLYKSLPQINIYDGQRRLLKTFTGEAGIDSLAGYIQ